MRLKAITLLSLIVLVSVVPSPVLVPVVQGQEISDVKVLMLIADYFGWNYFDATELLESWGVNVTTIANSLDTDVPSCLNKEPRGTIADLLLGQVENDIVNQFDVLFIPSGGQWNSLVQSARALEFIEYASDSGLLIAAVCIGNRVLADANSIVNGSYVVSYLAANLYMAEAGAIVRTGYRTVIDNNFITGGAGGGPSEGGNEAAPTEEVCLALVREELGYSFMESVGIEPVIAPMGTAFTITAGITDLDDLPVTMSSGNQNISQVNARIYAKNNRTLIDVTELLDEDGDGVYSGQFIASTNGEFVIDIEIEDTNHTLEIEREPVIFSVGTHYTIDPLTLGLIAAGTLLAAAVIIIMKKK